VPQIAPCDQNDLPPIQNAAIAYSDELRAQYQRLSPEVRLKILPKLEEIFLTYKCPALPNDIILTYSGKDNAKTKAEGCIKQIHERVPNFPPFKLLNSTTPWGPIGSSPVMPADQALLLANACVMGFEQVYRSDEADANLDVDTKTKRKQWVAQISDFLLKTDNAVDFTIDKKAVNAIYIADRPVPLTLPPPPTSDEAKIQVCQQILMQSVRANKKYDTERYLLKLVSKYVLKPLLKPLSNALRIYKLSDHILVLSNGWTRTTGGVGVFNMEMCKSLAKTYYVTCILPPSAMCPEKPKINKLRILELPKHQLHCDMEDLERDTAQMLAGLHPDTILDHHWPAEELSGRS